MSCPTILATSMPGRDSWALEELMDTVMSRDPRAEVRATRYRGVFEVYTSLSPRDAAALFLLYQHAFLASVVPVMSCSDLRGLPAALGSLLRGLSGPVRLVVRAREPMKDSLTEELVRNLVRSAGLPISDRAEVELVVESIDYRVVMSVGQPRRCGPHCTVLVPVLQ